MARCGGSSLIETTLAKSGYFCGLCLMVCWISGCAHLPHSVRPMANEAAGVSQSSQADDPSQRGNPRAVKDSNVRRADEGSSNPLRSGSVTPASFEDPSADPWADPAQDETQSNASVPELVEPINSWVDEPERLPKPGNDIAGGDHKTDRNQVSAAIADTAEGYLQNGPNYRPQNLHRPIQSATEYALTLQRDNDKLLEKISQLELQRHLVEKKLQAEAEAHAATRAELETSNQIVARLSYEKQKLAEDNTRWSQRYSQLEQRYRDYTRGVEQSLDEMLMQALAKQSGGN